jgi:DNA polymerase V
VAPTKVLSKVANRLAKKDKIGTRGVMVLQTPEQQMEALMRTEIEDVWGVGTAGSRKLRMFNINTAWDLRNMNEDWARNNLGGVVGVRLLKELKGLPCIDMKDPLLKKKVIATTRMFGKPVYELRELKEAVATYVSRATEKLRRQQCAARAISVFIVFNNRKINQEYEPTSRSLSFCMPEATYLTHQIIGYAMALVEGLYREGDKYIKAGVILSEIVPCGSVQFNLFTEPESAEAQKLMHIMDNINFGIRDDMVKFAVAGTTRNWKMRQEMRSQRFTTRWDELCEVK